MGSALDWTGLDGTGECVRMSDFYDVGPLLNTQLTTTLSVRFRFRKPDLDGIPKHGRWHGEGSTALVDGIFHR